VVRAAPETLELVRQAVQETVRLAHAKGIALSDTMPADLVKLLSEFPSNFKPSMLVDLERGRRLEVEWLNGAVSRLGKELGVPTPMNDFIYASLKPWANGKLP
jgi:2-dehydropantoate 2-reductase